MAMIPRLRVFRHKAHSYPMAAALQINIIPLPVTMNRKIGKPSVKLNFRRSQKNIESKRVLTHDIQVLPLHSFIYISCLVKWHNTILLLLLEMHNPLHLPVYFFFPFFSFLCQPYPKYCWIRSKIFYRPLNSWFNSVVCSYKKEICYLINLATCLFAHH